MARKARRAEIARRKAIHQGEDDKLRKDQLVERVSFTNEEDGFVRALL